MPLDNEQTLIRTKRTVDLVSGALRSSVRRLSLIGRRKIAKNVNDALIDLPICESLYVPEPSDYRIRSKKKDTLVINSSSLPRFGSCRVKQRPTFTSRNQPLGTVRCELASQDNHFAGYVSLLKVHSVSAMPSLTSSEDGNAIDQRKITSFEKRRRQNQDYGVALHAKQSLFCPEQASQIEIEIITLTNRDFIVQISAPNGEKSPPLSIQTSGLPARFSPSNVGCGHGFWRLEVFEREQAKFVPRTTKELNLRGCGLLVFEVLRTGELRLFDRLWLDVID
ncbi:hypothetical protein PENTCL1PPCAC_30069 [Pristionchus entomophagus]|uniref:Uncharacterized protein n=1 Tax=Pristionchus entomophagus TaxID=358040 RepID=A0AAV5ULA3_9BILA|nr:hypothetical protein PENTCL1PPCAC_30069 [Pristionchus entomophagus]